MSVEFEPAYIVEGFAFKLIVIEELLDVAELEEFEVALENTLEDEVEEAVLPEAVALAFAVELAPAVLVAEPEPVVVVDAKELEELDVFATAIVVVPLELLELDALPDVVEPASAVAVPLSPEATLVLAEPVEVEPVSEEEPVVPLLPEVVAPAEPEASAEPVAEPFAVAPWPEAVEDEELVVEVFELLDVSEPDPVPVELELEEEELLEDEEELEVELELANEVSANTASGDATITKTRARTRAFGSTDIRFFLIKIIVFVMYKNIMNALKLSCRALRFNSFYGKKWILIFFDL